MAVTRQGLLRSPLTALSLQAERLTKLSQSDEAREQTGLIYILFI